jgi:hypothetical protein
VGLRTGGGGASGVPAVVWVVWAEATTRVIPSVVMVSNWTLVVIGRSI